MENQPDYIEDFKNYLKLDKNYSINTVIAYSSDVKELFVYLRNILKINSVSEIAEIDIRGFLSKEYDKIKKTSLARKIESIKSYFNFLEKRHIISQNP
ncbi:MAG: site-specific integrase, partial [bacterium]